MRRGGAAREADSDTSGGGELAEERAEIRSALRGASADLLAYFERRLAVREDAADLLAETMLQAWRRVDAMPDAPDRRRMWLFTIAAHVLANQRRSVRRRLALADRLRTHLDESVSDDAENHAVRDAVLRLHAAQRELVMLIHWDGFTIAEAAELLALNPSTAAKPLLGRTGGAARGAVGERSPLIRHVTVSSLH